MAEPTQPSQTTTPQQPQGQVYAVLGDTSFEMVTYWNSFGLDEGMDFSEHALIGKKPRLQCTGEKLATAKIEIKLHHQYCDPEKEMEKLRAAMRARKGLRLVMGNGKYEGVFVIEGLGHAYKRTQKTGGKLIVETGLTLKEYVEANPQDEKKQAAKEQAKVNQASAPSIGEQTPSSIPAGQHPIPESSPLPVPNTRNKEDWELTPPAGQRPICVIKGQ